MNHYLIDYENVGVDGMNGIEQLDRDNRIYIFYTKNADKLTFDLHIKLIQAKAEVLLFKVESGQKNALDFQLSSYLGYLIRGHSDGGNNYFVVSRDRGFTPLLPFWKAQGITVSLVADYTGDEKNAPAIVSIINAGKTKQAINQALCKTFGSKHAGEIYRAVKALMDDKPGS